MKLTKTQLRQIIKEELSQLLEMYDGAHELSQPGMYPAPKSYEELRQTSPVVSDYLNVMHTAQPTSINGTPTRELLKLLWDQMLAKPGDEENARFLAKAIGLKSWADFAGKFASKIDGSEPSGDELLRAVNSKGAPTATTMDARSGHRGSF